MSEIILQTGKWLRSSGILLCVPE